MSYPKLLDDQSRYISALRVVVFCGMALTILSMLGASPISKADSESAGGEEPPTSIPITTGLRRENEAKIYHELDHVTTELHFEETQLEDVVQFLRDKHDLQIVLDRRALDQLGLTVDVPITMHVEGITLRSALNRMLEQYDLTFLVRHETLEITTIDTAAEKWEVRIYPVGDLVEWQDCFEWQETDVEKIGRCRDFDSLIGIIVTTIDSMTWPDVGGPPPIEIYRDSLVIEQSETTHHKICGLLKALREAR